MSGEHNKDIGTNIDEDIGADVNEDIGTDNNTDIGADADTEPPRPKREKRPVGNPNVYLRDWKDKLIVIGGWARDGLTNEQIAHNMGIHVSTLYDWKAKYEELDEVLKRTKEIADYQVENALFKKAMKGDVTACIFWLKNRKAVQWRDRKESTELEYMRKELELKERRLDLELKKLEGGLGEVTVVFKGADDIEE